MSDQPGDSTSSSEYVTIASCKRRGARFAVKLTNGCEFMLPPETVLRLALRLGGTYAPERWAEVVRDAGEETAYQYLLRLLNRRALSVHEAMTRVRKKSDTASATAAVRRAEAAGLLNDQAYATGRAEAKAATGRHGTHSISADLRRRGLGRAVVASALEAAGLSGPAGAEDEAARALALAHQRWPQLQREPDPAKRQRRLLGFLSRHGFPAGICYDIVRRLSKGELPEDR